MQNGKGSACQEEGPLKRNNSIESCGHHIPIDLKNYVISKLYNPDTDITTEEF